MENIEVFTKILDLGLPGVLVFQLYFVGSWLKKTIEKKDELLEKSIIASVEQARIGQEVLKSIDKLNSSCQETRNEIYVLKEKIGLKT